MTAEDFFTAAFEAQGREENDPLRFSSAAMKYHMDDKGPKSPRYSPVAPYPSPGSGVAGESSN